jgi:hypothetical protein
LIVASFLTSLLQTLVQGAFSAVFGIVELSSAPMVVRPAEGGDCESSTPEPCDNAPRQPGVRLQQTEKK